MSEKTWPGLAPFSALLGGAVEWDDKRYYLFTKDNRYLRYDVAADRVADGYPADVNGKTWPGIERALK